MTTTALLCSASSRADTVDDVGVALRRAVAEHGLAGAVAVIRDGESVRSVTAGYSDLGTRAGFAANTRVRVASITKTFAAATILQMVADGLVDLDAPVEAYLPGRLRGNGIDGRAISVRQVLQHTSGVPEYFDDPSALDLTGKTPDDVLDMALRKPALFPAGTALKYTNTNYVIAGLIIAAVAGRPADEEVTRRIIVPLGLTHTYFPAVGELGLRPPSARGYELVDGRRVDVTDDVGTAVGMDGSLISTGEDTTAFLTALLDGRVVPDQERQFMMDTLPTTDPAEGYGLGLVRLVLSCGVTVWGHGGDGAGYRSVMAKSIDGPAVAVTFTQSAVSGQDPRRTVLEAAYCPQAQ